MFNTKQNCEICNCPTSRWGAARERSLVDTQMVSKCTPIHFSCHFTSFDEFLWRPKKITKFHFCDHQDLSPPRSPTGVRSPVLRQIAKSTLRWLQNALLYTFLVISHHLVTFCDDHNILKILTFPTTNVSHDHVHTTVRSTGTWI